MTGINEKYCEPPLNTKSTEEGEEINENDTQIYDLKNIKKPAIVGICLISLTKITIVSEENENSIEGILRKMLNEMQKQIENIDSSKNKTVDELSDKFLIQENELKQKIEVKYNEILSKSATLPPAIREASSKKLISSREAELKRELEILKIRQNAEKERVLESFKEKFKNVTNVEKATQISQKIENLQRNMAINIPQSDIGKKSTIKKIVQQHSIIKCNFSFF